MSSAARSVRIGVIGRGFGTRVVAPVFDETEGCEVVEAISARDASGVHQLCARTDVDLIAVHSPPFLHLEHVRLALEAGHAVLCDKPFGRSVAEAEAMVSLATDASALGLVNYQFRYGAARARLRALIGDGAIGEAEHLESSIFLAVTRVPVREYGWLFDAELGGGWINAGGSHTVDMFRWLFGDVAKARAAARTAIASRPDASGEMHPCTAEDGFSATLVSLSGVSATLDSSFASPVNLESRITVFGSDGVLEQRGERSVSLLRTDAEPEEHTFDVSDPAQAFRRWAAVVRQAVVDGGAEAGAATFADGLAAARVLEALRAGGDPLGAS